MRLSNNNPADKCMFNKAFFHNLKMCYFTSSSNTITSKSPRALIRSRKYIIGLHFA